MLAATVAALRFASRAASPPPPLPKIAPRVAVLKPLHGLSEASARNILSFLEASYPRSEFVFGVSELRGSPPPKFRLRSSHATSSANITLSVGEEPGCANRKIAKLIRMAERAPKAEIFVLSDADVSVERDHLLRVVGELIADERTGVVTCLYRARPYRQTRLAARGAVRQHRLRADGDVSAAIEPMRHAFGATIAVKRAALERSAASARSRICSPTISILGRMAAERGYSVKLSSSIVTLSCEESRFAEFWNHQLRWARTYRTVRPVSLATILIHGPFWALMLLAAAGFNRYAMLALALVIGARIAMAAVIVARVLRLPELLRDLWLVPLKDLVMTAIWFSSLAGNRVWWGGRRFQILAGGAMREVKS